MFEILLAHLLSVLYFSMHAAWQKVIFSACIHMGSFLLCPADENSSIASFVCAVNVDTITSRSDEIDRIDFL